MTLVGYVAEFPATVKWRLDYIRWGIREKVLAAHRAGIRTVILPRRNELDLEDVPADLRRELNMILVDTVDQMLEQALEPLAAPEVASTTEHLATQPSD